jgi:hypothetical protein
MSDPEPLVRMFSSMEEAMDYMESSRMEASESAHPEQLALADGESHFYMAVHGNIVIMGRIFSTEEWIDLERKYMDMDNPEDVEEFAFMKRQTIANRERHLVPVRAFSVIEPQGEMGNVHVAGMAPATQEAFDEFIAAGCRVTHAALQPHVFQVIRHIRDMRGQSR